MSPSLETFKILHNVITFKPSTQEFLDENGKDRKHFKKACKRWYVSITIDKKQYSLAAHQFIYALYNPHLKELPFLTFINDPNDLRIENITIKDARFNREKEREEKTGIFKLYFTSQSDRDKAKALLKSNDFKCSTSQRRIRLGKDKERSDKIKQESNQLFPIRCINETSQGLFPLACLHDGLFIVEISDMPLSP